MRPGDDLDPPTKGSNLPSYMQRLKAFQLFAAGAKQSDIARELGVNRATITKWKTADRWETRIVDVADDASRAADFVAGNFRAQVLSKLRAKLVQRFHELDLLCGPTVPPQTRLNAIKTWVELAKDLEDELAAERPVETNLDIDTTFPEDSADGKQ